VKPGNVIRIGEPDYKYGLGVLILRVTEVGAVERLADGPWLNLKGVELRADGSPLCSHERYALVRLGALRSPPRSSPGRR
jgi:hypothetical protein